LNQPFVVATWDNGEAVRPRVFPTRAEALRVELPNADVYLCRWRESLPRHLTVRCESHCEFCAGRRGSVKRFSVEKCRLDVVRGHRFGCEGDASVELRESPLFRVREEAAIKSISGNTDVRSASNAECK
jgi:hypothetical protein